MTKERFIETKICKNCKVQFNITDKDLKFYEKVSPSFKGKKYLIPTPTLCPECRQQRRLSWRNERNLYKGKSAFSNKDIISLYSGDKNLKIYSPEEWWSDEWNPLDYARDFDFSRPFFEQFSELTREVPKLGRQAGVTSNNENSDYCSNMTNLKDCFLIFNTYFSENCYYGNELLRSKYCVDSYNVTDSENVYEGMNLANCYNVFYALNCDNCVDCYFVHECSGLKNCIDCTNLHNKSYYYQNKPIDKEDFERIKNEILKTKQMGTSNNAFHKAQELVNSENCTGNNIVSSKNCQECYGLKGGVDCKYAYNIYDINDCMDVHTWGRNSELMYDSTGVGNHNYRVVFCVPAVSKSSDMLYCSQCQMCKNCFGCDSLRNKEYCILNKQYTKEEYEELIPKIIEHMRTTNEWGELFPSSVSPFGYNETMANEYYPLTKVQALQKGYNWSDYEAPFPKVDKIIDAKLLGEDINKIPNDILNRAIKCEESSRLFIIQKQELDFYRRHNISIPKKHPDERYTHRMKNRNPNKLFDRRCDKCARDIRTSFPPEHRDKIYCEKCYNGMVY